MTNERLFPITLAEISAELRREQTARISVYGRMVESGQMSDALRQARSELLETAIEFLDALEQEYGLEAPRDVLERLARAPR